MVDSTRVVKADEVKLREVLGERGLPAKCGAQLTNTERKVHELLCTAYSFETNSAALDMPRHILARCGSEFQKVWDIHDNPRRTGDKLTITFSLTTAAIRTTLRTVVAKDRGIFKAKVNLVRLSTDWTKHMGVRAKVAQQQVDWSKHEAAARAHNAAVTEQILDGKTFNAHKDNPWARKHLKNRSQ